VRDQGPGVPPDERKAIFRKFYRGAGAAKSGVKGTGIGLATVSHIVRAPPRRDPTGHDPRTRSTFTIVLPEG